MKDGDVIWLFLLIFAVWGFIGDAARKASDERICKLEERIEDLERD